MGLFSHKDKHHDTTAANPASSTTTGPSTVTAGGVPDASYGNAPSLPPRGVAGSGGVTNESESYKQRADEILYPQGAPSGNNTTSSTGVTGHHHQDAQHQQQAGHGGILSSQRHHGDNNTNTQSSGGVGGLTHGHDSTGPNQTGSHNPLSSKDHHHQQGGIAGNTPVEATSTTKAAEAAKLRQEVEKLEYQASNLSQAEQLEIEAKRLRAEALEGKVSGSGHHQQGQGIAPGLQQQGNSGHQYGQQQSQGGPGINDPSRTVGANY